MIELISSHLGWINDPTAWVAVVTLIVLEIVLGIDNLIFISILTNKLPENIRVVARRIGLTGALLMRLVLLTGVAWIVHLTEPVFEVFGHAFSWRDMILIVGGLFLVWKATREIHDAVEPTGKQEKGAGEVLQLSLGAAVFQILLLDIVFSIDSIITAVGMTNEVAIMYIAVIVAVGIMLLAVNPLADFIERNPTIVMLALSFLLMIGMTLIADGMGLHVPKGYIYAAMGFSALVEALNMLLRRKQRRENGEG